MDKKHGMTGLRNAAKRDDQKKAANVVIRCEMSEKSGWVKTAQSEGLTLSAWIIKALNNVRKF
ncbi:MAG: hypothetical protein LV471_09235 [Nitrosomonas sp.]|nr:hypothetical protein [Nitrosomonas sp.]